METEIFLLTEIFYSELNLLISLKGGNLFNSEMYGFAKTLCSLISKRTFLG